MLSTTLRRILVASTLALATSGFMASSAFADYTPPAPKTGSISLEGVVNSTLTLSLTGAKDLGTITPQATPQSQEVGTATVSTNNAGGLTLYLDDTADANKFEMKNVTTNVEEHKIGFTVTSEVSGLPEKSNVAGTGSTSGLLYKKTTADVTPVEVKLYINYTATAAQEAGKYTGSIALKLMDN